MQSRVGYGTKFSFDMDKVREYGYDYEKMQFFIDKKANEIGLHKIAENEYIANDDKYGLGKIGMLTSNYLRKQEWFCNTVKMWILLDDGEFDGDLIKGWNIKAC